MYQHNRLTTEINFFQKFKDLDFILLFCIFTLLNFIRYIIFTFCGTCKHITKYNK